ncbi:zinc finger BED domain-containing protein 4-like [Rhizophagus clarus]|uniref:Zinc finger BED domain-containing protein 4-like n=1 Tax=Rhizophagus clarus TaxID=94130 RepID=A0A8H3LBZ4_9GLOM|nr:zinc finger BED domain-containing protein 4-like [Rhizophagus clarus]
MSSVEKDSFKDNKPRKLTSWIWQYFKKETKEVRKRKECINVLFMVYQVKESLSSDICGTEYTVLEKTHQLEMPYHICLLVQTETPRKGKKYTKQQQKELRQFLVDWIISDSLPTIHIVQSEAFWHFIYELDLAFTMPSYVRYPHTSAYIKDTLVNILNELNIREKVYIITTDNASNMKKCVQDIEGVEQLGCTAHILQLIIGKDIKSAEILIARTKQLIDFFMKLKQSERFEDAQKKFPGLLNELEREIALQNEEEDNEQDEQDIIDPSNTSAYLHTIADTSTR